MSNSEEFFGPQLLEHGWVPAPRYLLRRDRVLSMLSDVEVNNGRRLLEIGAGAGALISELSSKGYECTALESSARACELMRIMHKKYATTVEVVQQPGSDWIGKFDVICAFEVLEHIQDDEEALKAWKSWLRPGGRLIMSVPALMKAWNYRDVWAGHFRRYERQGLRQIVENSGFNIERFEAYGYPLGNMLDFPFIVYSKFFKGTKKSIVKTQATARSGTERKLEVNLYALQKSWLGRRLIGFFIDIQKKYVDSDRGNGFILTASRE